MNIDAFSAVLSSHVEDASWGTGAQATIIQCGDTILDLAIGVDGLDRPVTSDSIFPIYCAGKPLTSAAIAHLLSCGELSLDDEIGHIIEAPLCAPLERITIAQLLDHTAGLHHPAALFLVNAPSVRDHMVRSLEPLALPANGAGVYSEYAAWHLLGLVIESLTAMPYEQFVVEEVLRPLGVDGDFFFAGRRMDQLDRLRINVDLTSAKTVPLMWEAHSENLRDVRPAGGAHATMNGLARFYAGLLPSNSGDIGGTLSGAIAPLLERTAPEGFDPVLGRHCTHGMGFMVRPIQHGVALDEDAFGHIGFAGMTVAFADPRSCTVIAFHTNATTDPSISDPSERRRALIEALLPDSPTIERSLERQIPAHVTGTNADTSDNE